MKKILPVILVPLLVLLLFSCGENGAGERRDTSSLPAEETSLLPDTGEESGKTETVPAPETERTRPAPDPITAPEGEPQIVFLAEGGQEKTLLTSVDLRAVAVGYMHKMASVAWTAGNRMDFSEIAKGLIFEEGQTYLGIPYNWNLVGNMEEFVSYLENGIYSKTRTPSKTPGNSCSTSVREAWQTVSANCEYAYTIDMMPFVRENGVVPVGNVPWEGYDGAAGVAGDTRKSVLLRADDQQIYEAYALARPGDAFLRQLGNSGHALMATGETVTVRNGNGEIDPLNSYVVLTDQNTTFKFDRGYPSTWGYDVKTLFSDVYSDGYLPVTVPELRDNTTETPYFCIDSSPDLSRIGKGELICAVESNFKIFEVDVELFRVDDERKLIASDAFYPHAKRAPLAASVGRLGVESLSAGSYILRVTASNLLREGEVLTVAFTKGE